MAVKKKSLSKIQRFFRMVLGVVDPRMYLHGLKLLNYYNYSHVQPMRVLRRGQGCRISPNAVFSNPERLMLGDRVSIGARCHLWAGPGTGRIMIGDDALLGPDILVTAAGYRFNDGSPVTSQAMDEADVEIGRDVWLGAQVVVLPGAVIGDGAVIGAGSVVRGVIPPFAVAVGAPARVVGRREVVRHGDDCDDGAEFPSVPSR